MNDDMMLEYLLQMQQMKPEQMEMLRKQKQIDALRGASMDSPQGQMIGKHYVAPSLAQYAAQLGQGYIAGQAQQQQNAAMNTMNAQQRAALEKMRKKKPGEDAPMYNPYANWGESSAY